MASGSVKIEIPFDALAAAVSGLSAEEKRTLLAMLDDQLTEEAGDADEEAAVAEARARIEAGEFVTLDGFMAGNRAS
ncbi:MAG TPA: hypothetical protein VJN88_09330 [Ktedonobacterales bacterium]|nr:hypothetical protein [Ktedonobacterales bacterium]